MYRRKHKDDYLNNYLLFKFSENNRQFSFVWHLLRQGKLKLVESLIEKWDDVFGAV